MFVFEIDFNLVSNVMIEIMEKVHLKINMFGRCNVL